MDKNYIVSRETNHGREYLQVLKVWTTDPNLAQQFIERDAWWLSKSEPILSQAAMTKVSNRK